MPEGTMEDTLEKNHGIQVMRIHKQDCTGLVIDIQERLFPHMEQGDTLLLRCKLLIEGLALLEVPFLVTEQYPRGLGSTLDEIKELIVPFSPIEKLAFSCCDEQSFQKNNHAFHPKQQDGDTKKETTEESFV